MNLMETLIKGIAQRFLAWVVEHARALLVHDVGVANLGVGIGETEGAARARATISCVAAAEVIAGEWF